MERQITSFLCLLPTHLQKGKKENKKQNKIGSLLVTAIKDIVSWQWPSLGLNCPPRMTCVRTGTLHLKTCPNLEILLFSFGLSFLPHVFPHSADSKTNSQSTQDSYTYGKLLQIIKKTMFSIFYCYMIINYICLHPVIDQKTTLTSKYHIVGIIHLIIYNWAGIRYIANLQLHVVRYELS